MNTCHAVSSVAAQERWAPGRAVGEPTDTMLCVRSRSVVGNSHAHVTDSPDYGTSSSLTGGVHSLLESAEGPKDVGLSSASSEKVALWVQPVCGAAPGAGPCALWYPRAARPQTVADSVGLYTQYRPLASAVSALHSFFTLRSAYVTLYLTLHSTEVPT